MPPSLKPPASFGGSVDGGVLSGLLGGGSQTAGSGTSNCIGGIVSQFEQAGLGSIAQSWIGNRANQPVSPQQLGTVFGDQMPGMARQAGMEQGDCLSQLSQHLPNAVNSITPNGRVQEDGAMNV